MPGHKVAQGVCVVAWARVNGDIGGLVDHQEMFVLKKDVQRRGTGNDIRGRVRRQGQNESLSDGHALV